MNISSRIAWGSAFFFSVALFYAPLAYGCTRPEMLPTLYVLLIAGIITGLISFAGSGSWPALPKLVWVGMAAVLIQGWWIAWYPVLPEIVSSHDGVMDLTLENLRGISANSMVMTTILLGAFAVLCGLLAHPTLRRFILLSATLSGVIVCVFGDVLKIADKSLMQYFWSAQDMYWNQFALFHYHGNAGSFLILVWPLILVFTRRAYTPFGGLSRKIAWTIFSLTCAAAFFLNASKAALVIGLLIMPWPFATWLMRLKYRSLFLMAGCALLFLVGALTATSQLVQNSAFQRLSNVSEVSGGVAGRWGDYKTDLNAVPDVGWFGLGPGMFKVAFPYQLSVMRNVGPAVRDYAHEDYLQTVLEWGWFGTFWWTLLVVGGLYRAFRTYAKRELFTSKTERHLVLAGILGVVGTLAHALLDFPLQIASIRLFFLVLLALCWASPACLTAPTREPSTRRRFHLVIPSESGVESEAGVE